MPSAPPPAPRHLQLESGLHWDDLPVGTTFHSRKRTLTEADLVAYCNLTWLTEELFTNADPQDRAAMAIPGRLVPGGMVYTFAEGLVAPSFQSAGLAFLDAQLDMRGPSVVGDTLHVECEVIESRLTSKPRPRPGAFAQCGGEPAWPDGAGVHAAAPDARARGLSPF